MGLYTGSWCMDLAIALATVLVVIIAMIKRRYTFWYRKGVPCPPPTIPWGNATPLVRQETTFGELYATIYKEMKSKGHKYTGSYFFTNLSFMPIDLELVKNILTRDFQYFSDRGTYYNEKGDPLSAHIFSLPVDEWKMLRTKLTPSFTSGKLKAMFQTLVDCSHGLNRLLEEALTKPLDIKDVSSRYTIDVIGSCAFGIECNSLNDPNAEFREYSKKIFVAPKSQMLKGFLSFSYPKVLSFFNATITPPDVAAFFLKVVRDTMDYREKNGVQRNDFMDLLLQLKDDGSSDNRAGTALTFEQIAAQCYLFFLAGFETSSSTLTFCLYELSQNVEVQRKLRDEIRSVLAKHGGGITYDAVTDMRYMDTVIDETLRKYPPLPLLNRLCLKDYKIPNTDVVIPKGTYMFIPVLGIQNDEEYFPEPDKFDPDRFTDEEKQKRHPYTHIPFGEGPRICIGVRFGIMQTKVGLAVLLKNYEYSLNEKTVTPLTYEPKSFLLTVKDVVWLNVKKL